MTAPALAAHRFVCCCLLGAALGVYYEFLRPLRPRYTLAADALFLTGCMTKPQNSPPDWQQVNAPAVPQLPAKARQAPPAASCLPSCSAALTSERESWRQLLIRQESEDEPVRLLIIQ